MQHEVTISFDGRDWMDLTVEPHSLPTADWARHWLDEEFVRQDCSPLRASGKVLTVDKLLALASAMGPEGFAADPVWGQAFAQAACAALGKPSVRVDLSTMSVR